jgi:Mor family transcriptional regulator
MSEFIDDVKQRIIRQCAQLGISRDTAAMLAAEIAESVCRDYSGDRVYIGKNEECVIGQRNRSILRDWKAGERAPLIARRYGISERQVYRIVGN